MLAMGERLAQLASSGVARAVTVSGGGGEPVYMLTAVGQECVEGCLQGAVAGGGGGEGGRARGAGAGELAGCPQHLLRLAHAQCDTGSIMAAARAAHTLAVAAARAGSAEACIPRALKGSKPWRQAVVS